MFGYRKYAYTVFTLNHFIILLMCSFVNVTSKVYSIKRVLVPIYLKIAIL